MTQIISIQQVAASIGQGISPDIVLIMQGGACHVYSGSFAIFLAGAGPGNDIGTTTARCVNLWVGANPSSPSTAKSLGSSSTAQPAGLYNLTWNFAKGTCLLYNDSVYVGMTTVAKANCGPQISPVNASSVSTSR